MSIMAVTVAVSKDIMEMVTRFVNQVRIIDNQKFSQLMSFLTVEGRIPGTNVCQYNEDCPPEKLCDRLNRRCINPCMEDSCGDNAECYPVEHVAQCRCLPEHIGNPYVACNSFVGCRSDSECSSYEACINGQCGSPCECGVNAHCDVVNHRAVCKCPPGYQGDARIACNPPTNPCDPNPCGEGALCELDRGNPICFCPKGLTGNPFVRCSKYFIFQHNFSQRLIQNKKVCKVSDL